MALQVNPQRASPVLRQWFYLEKDIFEFVAFLTFYGLFFIVFKPRKSDFFGFLDLENRWSIINHVIVKTNGPKRSGFWTCIGKTVFRTAFRKLHNINFPTRLVSQCSRYFRLELGFNLESFTESGISGRGAEACE